MAELTTNLNTTVHECVGDILLGNNMPVACSAMHWKAVGELVGNEYVFNVEMDQAMVRTTLGNPTEPWFKESGFTCNGALLNGAETLRCSPPTSFAATYYPNGTATLYHRAQARQGVRGTMFAAVAVLTLVKLLDYGKALTAGTNQKLTRAEEIIMMDAVMVVSSSLVYDIQSIGLGAFHPTAELLLGSAASAVPGLFSVAYGLGGAIVISGLVAPISPSLAFLRRICYEMVLIHSVVFLTPASSAFEYHGMLNFFVGLATVVLTGRDLNAASAFSNSLRMNLLLAVVGILHAGMGFVLLLPMLWAAETVPPTFEVWAAAMFVVCAWVVGFMVSLPMVRRKKI
jgi:hypothetical protein